jgi:uroporphyrinogen-III synthase
VTGLLPRGLTIVVTRPAAQAGRFIALAEAAGASCLALPALEIEPIVVDAATRESIVDQHWDWAIYTSANAAATASTQGLIAVGERAAAVGGATARALAGLGRRVDATPQGRADSEGLLALPVFRDVRGLRILVLKGQAGRDLLPTQLAARGAYVRTVDLYRRKIAAADPVILARLHDTLATPTGPLVVAVTSSESLDGLLQLAPAIDAERLLGVPLVVPGERVAAAAQRAGWRGRILRAASAEDQDMLAALDRLAEGPAPGA